MWKQSLLSNSLIVIFALISVLIEFLAVFCLLHAYLRTERWLTVTMLPKHLFPYQQVPGSGPGSSSSPQLPADAPLDGSHWWLKPRLDFLVSSHPSPRPSSWLGFEEWTSGWESYVSLTSKVNYIINFKAFKCLKHNFVLNHSPNKKARAGPGWNAWLDSCSSSRVLMAGPCCLLEWARAGGWSPSRGVIGAEALW